MSALASRLEVLAQSFVRDIVAAALAMPIGELHAFARVSEQGEQRTARTHARTHARARSVRGRSLVRRDLKPGNVLRRCIKCIRRHHAPRSLARRAGRFSSVTGRPSAVRTRRSRPCSRL